MGVCLITGIGGFLGSHLMDYLLSQGWDIVGVMRDDSVNMAHIRHGPALFRCDVRNKQQIGDIVRLTRPDVIVHLAAQSLPSRSWADPEGTFQTNVLGTLNVLTEVNTARLDPLLLVAGSSAEYGPRSVGEVPISEDAALRPASPYGVSKVSSSQLALLYGRVYGLRVILMRPFGLIGARKVDDVCSDFARGLIAAERGDHASLKVGNVESVRDFLDVEDAVHALSILIQSGVPGQVYNVCSGVGVKVHTVLELLLGMSSKSIAIEHDPIRDRPIDDPILVGDNSRLRALGWAPHVSLSDSLSRILEYWRNRVAVS